MERGVPVRDADETRAEVAFTPGRGPGHFSSCQLGPLAATGLLPEPQAWHSQLCFRSLSLSQPKPMLVAISGPPINTWTVNGGVRGQHRPD
jgi:hypothetical protein